jgi:hypothetical protein
MIKKKPYCYIAGPMRGRKNFNFDEFDAAKEEVRKLGYIPVSPPDLDRAHEGWGKYPPKGFRPRQRMAFTCIRRDFLAILEMRPSQGDAMYMLRGWDELREDGTPSLARAERQLALCLRMKIIYQEGAAAE